MEKNMKKARFLFPAVLLISCLCVCLWGCNSRDDALVEFDGGCLTAQDLDAHYEKLKNSSQFRGRPEQLTPEFVFDHAVNMEMIIAKGLKENLHQDPRIRAQIHAYMSDLFLKVMQEHLVPQIDKDQFTEDQLKEFYETNQESYTSPSLLSVRMIKASDEQTALEARQIIEGAQMDFIEAAARYSVDKQTANRGGDIGTRSLKKFKPAWRQVIATLEPGSLSGPHNIDAAWYLFELVSKTDPVVHSYEEKAAYIRNDLLYARYREAWQNTYDRLKEEYKVKVNQDKLDAFILERTAKDGGDGDAA